jgi:hypothetical protein
MSVFERWAKLARAELARRAALAAVGNGKDALKKAARRIEDAVFGEARATGGDEQGVTPGRENEVGERLAAAAERVAEHRARTRAESDAEKEREKARADARAKMEREIEDELAALQRRIRR